MADSFAFRGIGRYRVAGIPDIRPVPSFFTFPRENIAIIGHHIHAISQNCSSTRLGQMLKIDTPREWGTAAFGPRGARNGQLTTQYSFYYRQSVQQLDDPIWACGSSCDGARWRTSNNPDDSVASRWVYPIGSVMYPRPRP